MDREMQQIPTDIPTLGTPKVDSPLSVGNFTSDDERVLYDVIVHKGQKQADGELLSFERAGPREKIYFDASKVKCGIVTCGGLCPGLNAVIRSLVMTLHYHYWVRKIVGVRYGLQGFIAKYGHEFIKLVPDEVKDIHKDGGTILGSSRGEQPFDQIVDSLEQNEINILFMIGGDGTVRATNAIFQEVQKRGLKKSVIAIPKTIDNDIFLVSRSFGFETAVELANQACESAHTEAIGAPNGIGLVRVMGRHSGYIAASAALASKDANVVLVPEEDFELEGERGVLQFLHNRIKTRGHALIVVAEGAGQKYFTGEKGTDASGNPRFGNIGLFLCDQIREYFKKQRMPVNLKYIDPSYIIRSVPAIADDNILCGYFGQNAVHAAMAGKTGMLVSTWNEKFIHVPFEAVVNKTKRIRLDSSLWNSVIETTGQPRFAKL